MMVDLGEMATADDMSDEENWTGGFYEMSLLLGAADDRGLDGPCDRCGAPRASRSAGRAPGWSTLSPARLRCTSMGAPARVADPALW